jgi:glutathione S-transferase
MKLYHAWLSSASRRVRLTLAEKNIEYESIPLDLSVGDQHKPEYVAINPIGVVPTLQLDDGRAIYEASFICEYLDDIVPEPRLRPTDPYQLAKMRIFMRFIDERMLPHLMVLNWSIGLQPVASKWSDQQLEERLANIPTPERREAWSRIARNPYTDKEKSQALAGLLTLVDKVDDMLASSPWVIDGQFSIADIAAFVFVTRAEELTPALVQKRPRVVAWLKSIRERPSYAKAKITGFAERAAARVEKRKL